MSQGALVCGIGESEGARGVVPADLPEDFQEHICGQGARMLMRQLTKGGRGLRERIFVPEQ